MFLNTLLLFVILFYVYPLKYMFTLFTMGILGQHVEIPAGGQTFLFTIYGIGVTAVFWILAALYHHAWRRRDDLQLNEVEIVDTRESIWDNFFMGIFGVVSIAIAHSPWPKFAGVVYFLIAIPKTLVPWMMGIKRRKREQEMLAAADAA